jgi:predicted 2-oxoglutarate/Fe(II)-dependent dioxygenase YbiX
VGLNERLRFLRYNEGEYFAPHCDGSFAYPADHPTKAHQGSYVTFQLYLNEGFEGGATRFFPESLGWGSTREYYDVVPKAGSVLLFEHRMYHEGEKLRKGRKYAIRSDVMYMSRERYNQENDGLQNVASQK